MAELRVVAPQGPAHVGGLASALENPCYALPEEIREMAGLLFEQINGLTVKINDLERQLRNMRVRTRKPGV